MTDVFDTAKRSAVMSRIHGKNTRPEMVVRKALHAAGYRFRLHRKDLPGKPDIVLPKYRVAVFVNGCFWHGHDCARFKWPETNAEFWKTKITRNMERDKKNNAHLAALGWRVHVIWTCEVQRGIEDLTALLSGRGTAGET